MPPYALLFPLLAVFCAAAVLLTALAVFSRYLSHNRIASANSSSDEILRRLDRIEHIVDSTAVEVERITESNRFMVKLIAEKSAQ
jgi:hypothetical protein